MSGRASLFINLALVAVAFLALTLSVRKCDGKIKQNIGGAAGTWQPAVNPAEVPNGGFVPGLYRVELDDGVTCYVAIGIFGDELSCVRP